MNHITYGAIFATLAVVSAVAAIFNFKVLSRFDVMNLGSRIAAILIAAVTVGGTLAFGLFSFQNFTYRAPQVDEMTKQLQEQIVSVKKKQGKYVQRIASEDYRKLSSDELYSAYSTEGKRTIDNLSKESELTKELFLRNIGYQYTEDGLITRLLKATNGQEVDFLDGKNRVLIFADTTEFSAKLLGNLREQALKSDVQLAVVFPITNGTDIDNFFANNSNIVGPRESYVVISQDSLANMPNLDVKYVAVTEYHVQNLPSYIAIDAKGIVSNVGVGSLIDSPSSAQAWLSKAFVSDQKYYDLIKGFDEPAADEEDTSSASTEDSDVDETTEGEESPESTTEEGDSQ